MKRKMPAAWRCPDCKTAESDKRPPVDADGFIHYMVCPRCRAKRLRYRDRKRLAGLCQTCDKNKPAPGLRVCAACVEQVKASKDKVAEPCTVEGCAEKRWGAEAVCHKHLIERRNAEAAKTKIVGKQHFCVHCRVRFAETEMFEEYQGNWACTDCFVARHATVTAWTLEQMLHARDRFPRGFPCLEVEHCENCSACLTPASCRFPWRPADWKTGGNAVVACALTQPLTRAFLDEVLDTCVDKIACAGSKFGSAWYTTPFWTKVQEELRKYDGPFAAAPSPSDPGAAVGAVAGSADGAGVPVPGGGAEAAARDPECVLPD